MQDKQKNAEIGEILFSANSIAERIEELGAQITKDFAGKEPLIVGVLKGSFVFLADLARCINLPMEFDFIGVSSYGSATQTTGIVRIIKDLDNDIAGKDVILVEDIIDSGLTFDYLYRILEARNPKSLTTCTLLLSRKVPQLPDYFGFEMPKEAFVIGYGLDAGQKYRELPNIHQYIQPEK